MPMNDWGEIVLIAVATVRQFQALFPKTLRALKAFKTETWLASHVLRTFEF